MKWYKALLLFVIAVVLVPITSLVGFVYQMFKPEFWEYLFDFALSLDQIGNKACQGMLNDAFTKGENRYSFGNKDETVSSALGKNQKRGTLSGAGKILAYILHKLDKNHSIDSIEINP